jgi:hypothetical protein
MDCQGGGGDSCFLSLLEETAEETAKQLSLPPAWQSILPGDFPIPKKIWPVQKKF